MHAWYWSWKSCMEKYYILQDWPNKIEFRSYHANCTRWFYKGCCCEHGSNHQKPFSPSPGRSMVPPVQYKPRNWEVPTRGLPQDYHPWQVGSWGNAAKQWETFPMKQIIWMGGQKYPWKDLLLMFVYLLCVKVEINTRGEKCSQWLIVQTPGPKESYFQNQK